MTVSTMRAFILLLAAASLLLTGCWDRTEVNDMALITAAGIDRKDERTVVLSVQLFIPRASDGAQQGMDGGARTGNGTTLVRSAEGPTIAAAMARLQEKLPRRIFWGHTEVFIFGRHLAEEGIRGTADFMIRHPQVRVGAFAYISKEPPQKVLELLPPLERSSSEALRELAKSKVSMKVTIKDLIQRLSGDEQAVGLPWIEILPPNEGKNPKQTIAYITGTAVFKEDRLVGVIGDRMTRGVLWLRNEIESAVVTVSPEQTEGLVSMTLLRAKTKLVPSIDNGTWKITLTGMTEDDIIQNETDLDLMNPQFTRMLKQGLEKDVQERVREVLDEVQHKMKADLFGFASAFHREYPKEWNEVKDRWDEIFPEVEVSVQVEAFVRRPGTSTSPGGLSKEEVKKK